MKTSEIRQLFLDYFAENGHELVASSPLVPANDPTLLFTNAGMVQFKDVFLGLEKRAYNRATTSQRCVRAGGKHNDLENVGYTARHHTFFEMLGNFSFGDYFKEDAIRFAWTFLTERLGFDPAKLWVTVYQDDDEAEQIWHEQIGVPLERIVRKDEKDNFWQMGDTGPCGPCSEIFFDHGPEVAGGPPGTPDEDGDRYIEVWNLVFMQYNRSADGTLEPLPKPSVDTGMGLERLAAVLQHVHSNYEIDLFVNLIKAAAKATGTQDLAHQSLRVIADHIRSTSFMIVDGVLPSNEGRGYVLRRIIRRAIRHGYRLGCEKLFFHTLVSALVAEMGEAYPELVKMEQRVETVLKTEEQRFSETIDHGLALLNEEIARSSDAQIAGEVAFKLYDTYGFPLDLTEDVAREHGLSVDVDGFEMHMEAQRERARAANRFKVRDTLDVRDIAPTLFVGYQQNECAAAVHALFDAEDASVETLNEGQSGVVILDKTPFYAESGGQVGDCGTIVTDKGHFEVDDTQKLPNGVWLHSGRITSGTVSVGEAANAQIEASRRDRIRVNHSATHLLHAALRNALGDHVAQRGSLVAPDRLRFDFTHDQPVADKECEAVESWVNAAVRANYPVEIEEMSLDAAKKKGATALFGEKYGDEVRVVTMGPNSMELCGGTHVDQTGTIGRFIVIEETGIASGVRRIEAISAEAADTYVNDLRRTVKSMSTLLKSPSDALLERTEEMQGRIKALERENAQLSVRAAQAGENAVDVQTFDNGLNAIIVRHDGIDPKLLRTMCNDYKDRVGDGVVVILGGIEDKAAVVVAVTESSTARLKAGDVVRELAQILGGKGGGKPDFAQGGGTNIEAIDAAMERAKTLIAES